MKTDALELGLGLLAGLAGTLFIRGGMSASKRWAPSTLPPVKEDPAQFMRAKAESKLPEKIRKKVPEQAETVIEQVLPFAYGMSFGMLYAALPRRERRIALDGTALGLATWAAGYLGWMPAVGLTSWPWKQKPKQVVPNLVSHALFGVISVAALRGLERRLR